MSEGCLELDKGGRQPVSFLSVFRMFHYEVGTSASPQHDLRSQAKKQHPAGRTTAIPPARIAVLIQAKNKTKTNQKDPPKKVEWESGDAQQQWISKSKHHTHRFQDRNKLVSHIPAIRKKAEVPTS